MTTISVQQFTEKYNGKSVDFDKSYGAQCVDLFNYYNAEVVGAPFIGTPKTGGARDLYEVDSKARDDNYEVLPPESELKIGDVVVFGPPHGRMIVNGAQVFYGHVAIYVAKGTFLEQNARKSQQTTLDPSFSVGMLGVLRPKKFTSIQAPQAAPINNNAQAGHTIVDGDTFWGLEERNGWPHGTLQQLNPNINPKELAIGSRIAIPHAATVAPADNATYYTITKDDTFWSLEDAWQLPHGTLQQLNPELNPRTLQIGQRIRRS